MRKFSLVLAGTVLCASLAAPQFAHANLLINGGLEVTSGQISADPSLTPSGGLIYASNVNHSNALTGWTIGGASVDIVSTSYWQNTQGNYSVDLVGTPGPGSISQTVTGLTPGTSYLLTFDFAINPENLDNEAGSTKIMQVTATNTDLAPTLFSGTAGSATKLNMDWVHETLAFTANASNVTLTMAALMPTGLPNTFTPNNVYCGPVIDNLVLDSIGGGALQAPEPASVSVLGLGTIALLRRRSSRSK